MINENNGSDLGKNSETVTDVSNEITKQQLEEVDGEPSNGMLPPENVYVTLTFEP